MAATYVHAISKGELPAKITATYQGDFNQIKNNLNAMIDYLNAMAQAATQIANNDPDRRRPAPLRSGSAGQRLCSDDP